MVVWCKAMERKRLIWNLVSQGMGVSFKFPFLFLSFD